MEHSMRRYFFCCGVSALALAVCGAAYAETIDVGDPDWAIRWDNTIEYTTAVRVAPQNSALTSLSEPYNSNTAQGDRNFKQGDVVNDRVDLFSEFDAIYQEKTGVRFSAAAWYDGAYAGKTAETTGLGTGNTTEPYNSFPRASHTLMGKDVELLDALVFHSFDLSNGQELNVRLGRFSQLYGETLFFGANGIAAAQGPVDFIKLLSVPTSTFKEIIMPVSQFSASWSVGHGLTVGAYYQFEYRPDRIPAVGSYFSDANIFGTGAQSVFVPFSLPGSSPAQGGNPGNEAYFAETKRMLPNSQGQAGAEIHWKASENWEFGLYGANYHEKDPTALYLQPSGGASYARLGDGLYGLNIGSARQVFNENVQTVGASFATAIGDINVSGEVSARHNQSIATEGSLIPALGSTGGSVLLVPAGYNNSSKTAYLRGDTLHANVSAISLFNENAIWDGGSFVGEIGANHLMTFDNKAPGLALNPTSTHTAVAARFIFEPSFFHVLPGLDISTPFGAGFGIYGNSALGSHLAGFDPANTADLSIGIKASYRSVWKVSLTYNRYVGPTEQVTAPGVLRALSYAQDLADRDFVSLSLKRTF